MFPLEVEQGNALPLCFSSYTVNKCPPSLFSATFFAFLCFFFFVILLLKMVPKHGAEVLSRVRKCKEVVLCLSEKMHVLGQLIVVLLQDMVMVL